MKAIARLSGVAALGALCLGEVAYAEAVAITVANVNEPPTNITISRTDVDENQAAGWVIEQFIAADPDGGTHTFALVTGAGGEDNASFSVHALSGILMTNAVFDYETKSVYHILVRATDQGGLQFDKSFTITVNDVNEPPIARNDTASTTEDAPSIDIPVLANDADPEGAQLLITWPPILCVQVVGVDCPIDYHPQANFCGTDYLAYTVTDGPNQASAVVTVTVACTPDPPTNISLSASSIQENRPAGTTVGTLATTDPDAGNTFTYSLATGTGDTDNGAFQIAGNALQARNSLDFEGQNSYSVRVRTTGVQDGLTFEKAFAVGVTNVNEAPADLALSAAAVEENRAAGTAVGDFSTTDPDAGGSFTYALVAGTGGTDNASFTLTAGGTLRTAAVFDYEGKASYSIWVRTTDQGGLPYDEVFAVAVANVNEPPTDLVLSAGAVDENSPAGTAVATVSVTDPDLESPTLSLAAGPGDADNAAFDLAGNELRLLGAPDFEAKASYSIRLRAVDAGGLSAERDFVIGVNDLNEAPTSLWLSNATVGEGLPAGTPVGTLSAADPDAGESLAYGFATGTGDADNGSFSIAGAELRTAAVFSFAAQGSYSVRLKVTDQGSLSFERAFTITVAENHAPTDIALDPAAIAENEPSGTSVGTLTAVDPDGDAGLELALVDGAGGEDNGSFLLDGATLRTVQPFDFEVKSAYSVLVRATDPGGKSREEAFPIAVTDANDPPAIDPLADRQAAAGIRLSIPVAATDQDGDTLFCAMTAGPPGALFDQNTCTFTWTPAQAQIGDWLADFLVLDDGVPAARATASAGIAVTPPLLFEPFTDGTAAGDPDWLEKSGDWSVDARKRFVSSPTRKSLALARAAAVSAFATGRISAAVVLGRSANPNAAIVFGYRRTGAAYSWRSVTLRRNAIVVGDQGGQLAKKVVPLAVGRRYTVTLDLLADGRVNVSVNGARRMTYKFAAPAAGRVGLAADTAKSFFDDVTVWDASMLAP